MTSADNGCPATLQAVTAVTKRQSLGRPSQVSGEEPSGQEPSQDQGQPRAIKADLRLRGSQAPEREPKREPFSAVLKASRGILRQCSRR